MILYLSLDRRQRVSASERDFSAEDVPDGKDGRGWHFRQVEVPEEVWTKMLRGDWTSEQQDAHHRQWWIEAGGDDVWSES